MPTYREQYESSDEESAKLDPGYDIEKAWLSFCASTQWKEAIKNFNFEEDDPNLAKAGIKLTFVLNVLACDILFHEKTNEEYYTLHKPSMKDFKYPKKETILEWIRKAVDETGRKVLPPYFFEEEEEQIKEDRKKWKIREEYREHEDRLEKEISDDLISDLLKKRRFKRMLRNVDSLKRYDKEYSLEKKMDLETFHKWISKFIRSFSSRIEDFRTDLSESSLKDTLLGIKRSGVPEEENIVICIIKKYLYKFSKEKGIKVTYFGESSLSEEEKTLKVSIKDTRLCRWPARLRMFVRQGKRRIASIAEEYKYKATMPVYIKPFTEFRKYIFFGSHEIKEEVVSFLFAKENILGWKTYVYKLGSYPDIFLNAMHLSPVEFDIVIFYEKLMEGTLTHEEFKSYSDSFKNERALKNLFLESAVLFLSTEPLRDPESLILFLMMIRIVKNTHDFGDREKTLSMWKKFFVLKSGPKLFSPSLVGFVASIRQIHEYFMPFLPKRDHMPLGHKESGAIKRIFNRNAELIIMYLEMKGFEFKYDYEFSIREVYEFLKSDIMPSMITDYVDKKPASEGVAFSSSANAMFSGCGSSVVRNEAAAREAGKEAEAEAEAEEVGSKYGGPE